MACICCGVNPAGYGDCRAYCWECYTGIGDLSAEMWGRGLGVFKSGGLNRYEGSGDAKIVIV